MIDKATLDMRMRVKSLLRQKGLDLPDLPGLLEASGIKCSLQTVYNRLDRIHVARDPVFFNAVANILEVSYEELVDVNEDFLRANGYAAPTEDRRILARIYINVLYDTNADPEERDTARRELFRMFNLS